MSRRIHCFPTRREGAWVCPGHPGSVSSLQGTNFRREAAGQDSAARVCGVEGRRWHGEGVGGEAEVPSWYKMVSCVSWAGKS